MKFCEASLLFFVFCFSKMLNTATREQFSLSLPILSSASLLAYQDSECMEKQKKNDKCELHSGPAECGGAFSLLQLCLVWCDQWLPLANFKYILLCN